MKAISTGSARGSRFKDQLGRPVYKFKYLSLRVRGGIQHPDQYGLRGAEDTRKDAKLWAS